MTYNYTIRIRQADGQTCGGGSKFKSFENARKRIRWAQREWKGTGHEVAAWAIINETTGSVEEQSGRL